MQVIFGATNCTWCTGQELYGRLLEDIAVLDSLMPAPDLRRIQVRTVTVQYINVRNFWMDCEHPYC
jgi:hypothetical protein